MGKSTIGRRERLDKPNSRFGSATLPSQRSSLRFAGIYAIRNLKNGHLYIGSSDHVARRLRAHVSQLRRGVHHSVRLQHLWNNKGEAAVEFLVLEVAPAGPNLLALEQAYIAELNPEYNFAECTSNPMQGRRHRPDSIEKMRLNRTGKGLGSRIFTTEHKKALSAAARRPKPWARRPRTEAEKNNLAVKAKQRFSDPVRIPQSRAVEVNGQVYANGRIASKALGISRRTLTTWLRLGKAVYVDGGAPRRIGFALRELN